MTAFQTKYAPRSLSDVVFHDDDAEQMIADYAAGRERPNLILHGPFGTGKTTIAKLLPDAIWSNHETGERQGGTVKEIGGATLRGIDAIRNIETTLSLSARHRFVIIDEADGMTNDALEALRGTMNKTFTWEGRWIILTTNHLHKIPPALQSRSLVVNIDYAAPERWLRRAKWILEQEGHPISDDMALLRVIELGHGDNREVLAQLQDLVNAKQRIKKFTYVLP